MDDASLGAAMAAAQAGDQGRYRELLQACVPQIRAVVRASGVAPDAVDDVIQDCLIAIHGARHTYDPARPFLPWLRAIAKRRAIDALRRRGRQNLRERFDPVAYDTAPDPTAGPGHRLEATDRARVLKAAISTLPPAQRQAVEQLALRERSLAEVSAATGRSKVSLKVNLHRALHSLRNRLLATGDRDE